MNELIGLTRAYLVQEFRENDGIFLDRSQLQALKKPQTIQAPAPAPPKYAPPAVRQSKPPPPPSKPQKPLPPEQPKPPKKMVAVIEDFSAVRKLVQKEFPKLKIYESPLQIFAKEATEQILLSANPKSAEEKEFLTSLGRAIEIEFGISTSYLTGDCSIQYNEKNIPLLPPSSYINEPQQKKALWQSLKSLRKSS